MHSPRRCLPWIEKFLGVSHRYMSLNVFGVVLEKAKSAFTATTRGRMFGR